MGQIPRSIERISSYNLRFTDDAKYSNSVFLQVRSTALTLAVSTQ